MSTGKVQEEEEKETQETRQEKEKEGIISFRLWLWLTDAVLKALQLLFFTFWKVYSSCSSDLTWAGDVHVSGAAVILIKTREARVPLCCQHRCISLTHFITVLIIVFAEMKTSVCFLCPPPSTDLWDGAVNVQVGVTAFPAVSLHARADILHSAVLDEAVILVPVLCM